MATEGKEQVSNSLVKERTVTLNDAIVRPIYDSIIICQDKIIVVGIKDNKVKIYRLHDGKFLDKLDSDSSPRDICVMDATTICVLHDNGLIEMASIKSENMSPVFTIMKRFPLHGLFDIYHSVVGVKDNIVVVGVKHDNTYWCIVSLDDGHVDTYHRICKMSFKSSVTTKDNIVYILCYAYDVDDNGVYGFDILNPSQCKYKYKLQHQYIPTSIVINEDGNIFVGTNGVLDNSSIHQLTASCQRVAIFTQGIPIDLHAMFWDNGRLYITCWGSRDITVFRHMYEEGSQKHSEFLMSHEKKEPIIVKTSKEIEQVNVEKGQSSEEMETHPSKQMPMDYGDDKDDQNPEEGTRFIEWIKESNFTEIELLLKNRMVPSKSTILHAIKEHGYNKGIQCLLKGMSNLLRKQIPKAIQVWSGYRTEDLHTPVFVVMFGKKTRIPEMKFSEPYDEYEIVFRKEHTPNQEEERVSEQSEVHAKTINKEDMKRVVDCIAENTESLMNEHSNLSIIAASTVKAKGFNGCLSKLELVQSTCIVLYVPVKGIIPVGEKDFVKYINGIETDVREGEFVFHVQIEPTEFHQNLRMGCRIAPKYNQSGTLGGFVDLPGGKTGCITAAHVVLNEQQRKEYVKANKSKKDGYNASLAEGQTIIEIYQPTLPYAFGRVSQIAFEEGNKSAPSVDAALIEVTDHTRTPNTGLFPFHNYPVNDFTEENPMMYNSGKIRDHSDISIGSTIVKYGYSTRITCGTLVFNHDTTVRMVNPGKKSGNTPNDYDDSYPIYFQQMEVKSSDTNITFSAEGDSGALVFMYDTTNRDLEAIGLLIGANTNDKAAHKTFVTPIKDVFRQLGLTKSNFKVFQMPNEGEENLMNDSS